VSVSYLTDRQPDTHTDTQINTCSIHRCTA